MKKLIAFLLVLCMVLSFTACKKPADSTDGTGESKNQAANNNEEETEWTYEHVVNTGNFNADELVTDTNNAAAVNKDILNNDDLINPEKFAGKTIQIYGYNSAVFEDIDEMGKGSFIWMVRAAVDEWAALNKVKVEYVGDFDPNVIMGDINAGGKPDLLLYANVLNTTAPNGIIRPFTEEEYKELARTCGNYYLDMVSYKGKSVGVQSPWSGGTLFYYNKTLFEQYGVKTPAEYVLEGNWNWETFEKCITEITKDTDGDGKMDIYGSGRLHDLHVHGLLTENEDGTLTSNVRSSSVYMDYLQLCYKAANETKSYGPYADCNIATTPRPATHMGDAEWYNFQHLNQELVNGDQIEVCPMPMYKNDSDYCYTHTPVYSSILTSCDEPEATLSLLNYTLRVGMRYMSDFSLGLYKCNYEGIRGASKYAHGWKQNFEQIVADRQEEFDNLDDWNQELYEILQSSVLNADHHHGAASYTGFKGAGTSSLVNEVTSLPPASALPIIAQRHEAAVNTYNSLYAK